MKLLKKTLTVTVLIVLGSTVLLSAGQKSERIKTAYPVASAILVDAYRYLGSLNKFSFDAITTNDDMYRNIMRKEVTHKVHVDLQRPNKLSVHISGDLKNRSSYILNGTFNILDHDLNLYGTLPVPKTTDRALDYLFEKFDMKSPLANLLYTDLDKRVAPKKNGYYFGTTQVDGKACHHVGFNNEQRELQVWIEKGKRPLIKKFSIIDKSGKVDLRSTTVLRWDINPHFKKRHFVFKAPKNAVKISVVPAK